MKWEPLLAMAALFLLGLWLVWGPSKHPGIPPLREGAWTREAQAANQRGVYEVLPTDHGHSFRLLFRNGAVRGPWDDAEFRDIFGDLLHDDLTDHTVNPVFRLFNITSWGGLIWVAIGLGGQAAFFGRMAVQWIVSEKERRSTVPPIFWYLSLIGGVALFTYFAWRQDVVGVLGQTTGVVIYARNIRLIFKERERAARRAARAAAADAGDAADAD